jgi:hypothetical protein
VRSVTVLPRPASPKKVGSARSAGSGSPRTHKFLRPCEARRTRAALSDHLSAVTNDTLAMDLANTIGVCATRRIAGSLPPAWPATIELSSDEYAALVQKAYPDIVPQSMDAKALLRDIGTLRQQMSSLRNALTAASARATALEAELAEERAKAKPHGAQNGVSKRTTSGSPLVAREGYDGARHRAISDPATPPPYSRSPSSNGTGGRSPSTFAASPASAAPAPAPTLKESSWSEEFLFGGGLASPSGGGRPAPRRSTLVRLSEFADSEPSSPKTPTKEAASADGSAQRRPSGSFSLAALPMALLSLPQAAAPASARQHAAPVASEPARQPVSTPVAMAMAMLDQLDAQLAEGTLTPAQHEQKRVALLQSIAVKSKGASLRLGDESYLIV